jgi:signal transduction histidine kinase
MLTMPSPTAQTAPSSADPPLWQGFARRGLRNQLLCTVIAVVIWLMTPNARGNLFTAWVYSAAIGTGCWFFIDGGRLLLAGWLPMDARLHPEARRARWPGVGWMLVCILVGTALGYTLGVAVGDAVTGFNTPSLLQNRAALVISTIAAMAATAYFYANERLRAEQAAAETARREATESQLRLLQSQLEPHMLFNTLANLRVLIALDAPRAQAMLDRLISYLRTTLGASHSPLHSLATEFAWLDDYLALMAVRMGPRLQVQLHLPDDLRQVMVPPLLLQPVVENSIRHGLEPKLEGGRIEVRAQRQGQQLVLTVRDTGVGLPPAQAGSATPDADPQPAQAGSHYGTRHVAARLATLYGALAESRLVPAEGTEGGTLAELRLPWPNPAPASAA